MKRWFYLALILIAVFCCAPSWATVADSTATVTSNCNGSATSFAFTFGVGATSEVRVTETDSSDVATVLTETTNYTVVCTNNDCSAGGTVVTTAVCPSGSTITIEMNVPYTQEADFTEGMATLYETFEDGLDKLTRIAQQLKRDVGTGGGGTGGSMTYPGIGVPYSTGASWGSSYTVGTSAYNLVQLTASGTLPSLPAPIFNNITGSTQCLHVNASGQVSGTGADCGSSGGMGANADGYYLVNQSTNAPTNAINLGLLASGLLKMDVSGAVATMSSYPLPMISVSPSADATGATDAAAIQAAIASAVTNKIDTVMLEAGQWYINTGLTISSSNVKLIGRGSGGWEGADAATKIRWVGSSGGTMLTVAPVTPSTAHLDNNGVDGIYWDCYNVAAIGVHLQSTNYGNYDINGEECTTAVLKMSPITYTTLANWADPQKNVVNLTAVVYDSTGSCLLLDGTASPNVADVSLNYFPRINCGYGYSGTGGVGVELKAADTNRFGDVHLYKGAGTNHTAIGMRFDAVATAALRVHNNWFDFVQAGPDTNGYGGGVTAQGTESSTYASLSNFIRRLNQADTGSAFPTVTIGTGATLYYAGDFAGEDPKPLFGLGTPTAGNVPVYGTRLNTLGTGYAVVTTVRASGTADNTHLATEAAIRSAIGSSSGGTPAGTSGYFNYNSSGSWAQAPLFTDGSSVEFRYAGGANAGLKFNLSSHGGTGGVIDFMDGAGSATDVWIQRISGGTLSMVGTGSTYTNYGATGGTDTALNVTGAVRGNVLGGRSFEYGLSDFSCSNTTYGNCTLTAYAVAGAVLSSYGYGGATVFISPTAGPGMSFFWPIYTTGYSLSFKPASGGVIYLDGVALTANYKATLASPTAGDSLSCSTFKTGSSTWSWYCKSGKTAWADGGT